MHVPATVNSIGLLSRIRIDGPETAERMAFELMVGERVVMASLDQMLDALWYAQELKLVGALPPSWWDNVTIHKDWGKPVMTAASLAKLEKLDAKFAPMHARQATKRPAGMEMASDTDAPYNLLVVTLLQCVYIAEQVGMIPPLGEEWLAREISPLQRELSEVEPAKLH